MSNQYKVVYLEDKEIYLITKPSYGTDTHYINDIPVKSIDGQIFTSKIKPVITNKYNKAVFKGWHNPKTDETISSEEYKIRLNKLATKGTLIENEDDDDEELVFDDITAEVAYKHFKRDWNSTYGYDPVEEEISYTTLRGMVDSNENYIVSMLSLDSSKADLFSYNSAKHLFDLFSKFKEENTQYKYDVPTHSGLYYVKINGKYIFSNNPLFKLEGKTSIGTLEQCKTNRDANEKAFKIALNSALFELKDAVNTVTIQDVLNAVCRAQNEMTTVHYGTGKKRTEAATKVSNELRELKTIFENLSQTPDGTL